MDSIQIPKIDNVVWISGKVELTGSLHLTAHQLLLKPFQETEDYKEIWFHYALIHSIDKHDLSHTSEYHLLHLICKNFTLIKILIQNEHEFNELYKSLCKLINTVELNQLYAFYYEPEIQQKKGWTVYNALKEFERQGVLSNPDWRVTHLNEDYQFSPTYPQTLLVPSKISDSVLRYAAKFRSKYRLPVLSFIHKNKIAITRSSQPLTGLNLNRSMQDEKLVEAIFTTGLIPENTTNLIVDARPTANAVAQTALGAGTELIENYPKSKLMFLGIENIHAVRDSMNKVLEVRKQADLYGTSGSLSLDKTGWLKHIKTIIEGAATIVDSVHYQKRHVLVHCSDGWDRTAQLCSLSEICLDPYYRTLEGFAVLIEKEWCSFGHKFNDRSGHISKATDSSSEVPSVREQIEAGSKNVSNFLSNAAKSFFSSALSSSTSSNLDLSTKTPTSSSSMKSIAPKTKSPKEFSPVFTQFLDCVYQIWTQYPTKFEFSENLLLVLNTHLYSCQFGTFLLNSENERNNYQDRKYPGKRGLHEFTWSIWDDIFAHRLDYINPLYDITNISSTETVDMDNSHNNTQILSPNSNFLRYWSALFVNISSQSHHPSQSNISSSTSHSMKNYHTSNSINTSMSNGYSESTQQSNTVDMLDISELNESFGDFGLELRRNPRHAENSLQNDLKKDSKNINFTQAPSVSPPSSTSITIKSMSITKVEEKKIISSNQDTEFYDPLGVAKFTLES